MPDKNSGENPSAAFVVEVVIVGLCVFAVAITVALVTDAGPGSTPDWIAALSTFAAFIAAVFAGWYAHRALRVEQRRDAHRDNTERRAQAVMVAAWADFAASAEIAHTFPGDGAPTVTVGPTVPALLVATVHNASPLPVHQFWLQVYLPAPDRTGRYVLVADHEVGRVLPGETKEVDLLDSVRVWPDRDLPSPSNPIYQKLAAEFAGRGTAHDGPPDIGLGWSFRDNGYVEWVREPGFGFGEGPRPDVVGSPAAGAPLTE
ncbi:hypothetical protein FB382_001860 [Nocardioides ginsengisegetis]|uniref:Uncharacterized protein n=1 Tax=Nocardioides ginsengisegetis TaxID=661491 RepID=A0A7W3IZS5_9ACTN|nr:hypothetical protein [Nocardioides ginsengisegetis]MBA8803569.1 hypothetical protein [Nocardioides ginsengisegetis]